MKFKKHLLMLSCSMLIGYSSSAFGAECVFAKTGETARTLRQLEQSIAFVEKKVTEDDSLRGYEEVFYGSTLNKELGLSLKLYRSVKDKHWYSVILAYCDSFSTTDGQEDKMYFTQPHWAGESVEEVLERFENENTPQNRYINNKAKYCKFYSEKGVRFFVGVPFIEDKKRGILIYGIRERNDEGKECFEGYGNGKFSLKQTENSHNQ